MTPDIFKTFDTLQESVKSLGEQWKEATVESNEVNTYAGIQKRMKDNRFFFENEHKDYDKKLKTFEKWYSKGLIGEQRAKLDAQFKETASIMEKATLEEIENLTQSRKEKVAKMLATPPTSEQLRLLQVLEMRNDVSSLELHHILPTFFGNYQAMKVLQSIGRRNGISIMLPQQLDPRYIFETIQRADRFLKRACDDISKPWPAVSIVNRAFYTSNKDNVTAQYDPEYTEIIDVLDSVPQLQDVKAEKAQLTPTEEARINHYFKDVEGLDASMEENTTKVLKPTKKVMEQHPEDVDALKLSKYSGFVAEVVSAKHKNEKTSVGKSGDNTLKIVSAKPKIVSAKHESVGTSGVKASDNSQKIGSTKQKIGSTKQKFESAKSENTGGND